MAMPVLATQDDLTRFGYAIPVNADNLLDRASVRVRLAAGHQTVTADTSTVTFPPNSGNTFQLWQFPCTGVHAVTAGDGTAITDWTLTGNEITFPCGVIPVNSSVTITYTHGFATLPDELVEVVCAVAVRLSGTKPDRDPAVIAQAVGDVSQTLSPVALDMASGLLPGEFATVRRIFYRRG